MNDQLFNLTIPLVSKTNKLSLYIQCVQFGMMYNILRMPKQIQWSMISFAWLTIIVGTYFQSILYVFIYQQYRTKEATPINALILVVSLFEHLTAVAFSILYTMMVAADATLEFIIGPWLCYPITLLYRFVVFYSIIGKLGISIYRILLIKCDELVRYKIGLRTLLCIILFIGVFVECIERSICMCTNFVVECGYYPMICPQDKIATFLS